MSVATFVCQLPKTDDGEELIVFLCTECDEEILATESDSHAHRKHKASMIRVFGSPGVYADWRREEETRAAIMEATP